jgi:putative transposase
MNAATNVMPTTGVVAILVALGLSVATFYRRRKPAQPRSSRPSPARALSAEEREGVLALLHEPRFVDKAPAEVIATLLEEGRFPCSERTMYRILQANNEVRERRDQLRHPAYTKPELIAVGPNDVWTWDITKLRTHVKFQYLYLYVIIDIFSRYVVGWLLAENESAQLAQRLVKETCDKHGVTPGHLHAARGPAMKSKLLSQLLAQLDIQRSLSRPHVSNDNPFSESQFKTLKYHPSFPDKFGGLDDGLAFGREFFPWYNEHHHHSALAYLTPSQVHFGHAEEALRQRHEVLMNAYRAHPERFVGGPPQLPALPRAVFINPPTPPGDRLQPSSESPVPSSGSSAPDAEQRLIVPPPLIAAGGAASCTPTNSASISPPIHPGPLLHRSIALATSTLAQSTGGLAH